MARKTAPAPAAPSAPPKPTRDRVAGTLARGDYTAALEQAVELHHLDPSPENLALLKKTIVTVAGFYSQRNQASEFNRAMELADLLDSEDAAWAAERCCLLAQGGRLSDALVRADEATRPRVLALAADRALRQQSKEFLPDDLHAGYDAVLAAFRHYEANNDEAARQALEPLGLRSPFLEWKILLRGLMAHAVGDDTRAAENFGRLDPTRIPAKLAEPYRSAVDRAWQEKLPPAVIAKLNIAYRKLNAAPLVERLREIAKNLSGDRPLVSAFRTAESILSSVKHLQPHLLPRLANCFYHAIIQKGVPEDLSRFRKLFGSPPDDPQFHKLQALIEAHCQGYEESNEHWKKFDEWLAGNPPGWPAEMLQRARAAAWTQMGYNAEQAADAEEEDPALPFGLNFDDLSPSKKQKKAAKLPSPLSYFKKAAELAPDWSEGVLSYCDELCGQMQFAEAAIALRGLLEKHPEDLPALRKMAQVLHGDAKFDECLEYCLRACAVNPLDRELRETASDAVLARARSLLALVGTANDIAPLFETHRELLEEFRPLQRDSIAAVAAMKLKRMEEAETLHNRLLADSNRPMTAAYHLLIDTRLANATATQKKAAKRDFDNALKNSPLSIIDVRCLFDGLESYARDGWEKRTQKTEQKAILSLVPRCTGAAAPELEFETLGIRLNSLGHYKIAKKYSEACVRRFPHNPAFLLLRAQSGVSLGDRLYTIEHWLLQAQHLAEQSREPRHRALLPTIEELLKQMATPFDILDSFFGRRR